ncbi:ABC transporter substrate-binding protein [Brachybacterium saurashtrense]|uniref:Extracellular solute-binding protein n=1 Tax=Brachybacterium saurashtrense TaxID=556288 RepID=A0A345YJV1_9MICO|nr:extracellular solute-binding protein [Brachybacterium saurashtrense]AXK44203.1 extracellular solute-binding protein [Brachybacterium saurashtrense]RRR21475.1 extracellular solute-binding protein [Brachybacterium saurashtrense]
MSRPTPSRRSVLSAAALGAAGLGLAGCSIAGSSSGSGGSGGDASATLTFWDMPWGTPEYNEVGSEIIDEYAPADGFGKAAYQTIQWNGFYQTFASAIASGTGPAVSSGAGFQAYQFAEQGAIAYADDVLAALDSDPDIQFLDGLVDTLNSPDGHVAVPWQIDVRPFWFNTALLEEAGVSQPTTWDELFDAGLALKKIGVSGFATGTGSGNNLGSHTMVAMMINNGGGLFDSDGAPDALNPANVEAMEFVLELVKEGIVDKGAVSFTQDNLDAQWNDRKAAIGIHTPGLSERVAKVSDELVVGSPLASTSGTRAGLYFVNNLMMYTNTPSQEASEAFLTYYLGQLHRYWEQPVGVSLPALTAIADSDAFRAEPNRAKIVDEWVPVCSTYAAQKSESFAALASVDGGQALAQFAQTILQGSASAKDALTTLQSGLEEVAG